MFQSASPSESQGGKPTSYYRTRVQDGGVDNAVQAHENSDYSEKLNQLETQTVPLVNSNI